MGTISKVPKVTEQQPLLATQRLMNSVMSPSLFFPDTFSLNAWLFLQVLVLVGEFDPRADLLPLRLATHGDSGAKVRHIKFWRIQEDPREPLSLDSDVLCHC